MSPCRWSNEYNSAEPTALLGLGALWLLAHDHIQTRRATRELQQAGAGPVPAGVPVTA